MIEYTVKVENGSRFWYINGELHREDGPAIDRADGYRAWFINGELHRDDGPAIELADGTRFWYLNGEGLTETEFNNRSATKELSIAEIERLLGHRIKVIEYTVKVEDGTTRWFHNGKLHREDGPAIERSNGSRVWYLNGELHRDDGPAIELADGYRSWYINGEGLTETEFNNRSATKELSIAEIERLLGFKVKVIK
jgi:hypothetical protein